jgi:polyisoprenoid-binding protein YceI
MAFGQRLTMNTGKVDFISEAPFETIKAKCNKLQGIVDLETNTFAFSMNLTDFQGFNSSLQKEHFNESYMESGTFPKSTFTGKLIDKFDAKQSKQTVRAKGYLEMHGIKAERIIPVTIVKVGNEYSFSTEFNVLISDHGIKIPKIVHQKISEYVTIKVAGILQNN